MNPSFKTRLEDVHIGDVFFTKTMIGRFAWLASPDQYRCEKCVMFERCDEKRMWRNCSFTTTFVPVEMTEEIEAARDLFALKGELW